MEGLHGLHIRLSFLNIADVRSGAACIQVTAPRRGSKPNSKRPATERFNVTTARTAAVRLMETAAGPQVTKAGLAAACRKVTAERPGKHEIWRRRRRSAMRVSRRGRDVRRQKHWGLSNVCW